MRILAVRRLGSLMLSLFKLGGALIRGNGAGVSETKIIAMDSAPSIGFAEPQGFSERQEVITQIRFLPSFNHHRS